MHPPGVSYIKDNHDAFIEECPTNYNIQLDNNPVGEHFMKYLSDWNYTFSKQLPGPCKKQQQEALSTKSLGITHSPDAHNWIAAQASYVGKRRQWKK